MGITDSRSREALSHLLQDTAQPSANGYEINSSAHGYDGQQASTTYSKGDIQVTTAGLDGSSNKWSQQPTAILWNGNLLYYLGWDLLGIVFSLCFLVLGACVASLKDKHESRWSNHVIQATQIAPSLWPVIFSGIVGNALRALADWKVETGVELLTLEQLLGSLTMAGSLVTVFRWSIFRFLSAILIFLWAFNPVGSQASFRGVSRQASAGTYEGRVSYYNASIVSQFDLSVFGTASNRMKPTIRALYSATLYDYASSIQYVNPQNETTQGIKTLLGGESAAAIQVATDNWGNVRIPHLEYLPNYDEKDPHGWVETPWDKKVLNYSSLLGDRVEGIDRTIIGNTSFLIESSHQRFSCAPWFYLNNTNSQTVPGNTRNTSELEDWLKQMTGKNYRGQFRTTGGNATRTFFVSPLLRNVTSTPGVPELLFGTRGNDITNAQLTRCTARTVYVDANVTCISRGSLGKATCGVNALRRTAQPPEDPSISALHPIGLAINSMNWFMDMLEDPETGIGGSGSSSPTEEYLHDPLTAFVNRGPIRGYVELSEVDIATFERRFSLMWNTLWKIGWAQRSVMGGQMWQPIYADEVVPTTHRTILNATSVITHPLPPVYAINKTWLTVYFISVGIMLAAAVFALVVHSRCRAPAVLGYVSSLMRDSIYFQEDGVHGNSAEDGSAKTKRLGKVKVMLGDMKSENDAVGKMAFAPAELGKRVQKGRWYD